MKRLLSIITLAIVLVISASAQVAPAKFFDNTSIELKGGINTPLHDPFKGISEQVGIQIEKGITPWFGLALDGEAFIHQPYWYDAHTAFDGVNVNALTKFNLFNLFGTYPGYRRVFELTAFTGIGWGHHHPFSERRKYYNYMNYTAGLDLEWNLGKVRAWAIRLSPAVTYACPEAGKLNVNKAMLELNVGVVYHFKNHDGNRYFTKIEPYDYEEVEYLTNRIDQLTQSASILLSENKELKNSLAQKPSIQTITETIEVVKTILPPVQFLFNSAEISETSYASINEIANVILTTPDNYIITGYASNEGTEEYNIGLSQERADAMKNALVNCGINPDRLITKADGITTKFSETEPSLNRIVTVSVE